MGYLYLFKFENIFWFSYGGRPHRPHGSATAVHRTCIDHAQPLLWLAIPMLLNIRIFNSFGYTLLFLMSITVV